MDQHLPPGDPDLDGQKSAARPALRDLRSGDWPDFVGDDDAGRGSVLGPAITLILGVIVVALVGLITVGWRIWP